MVLIEKTKVIVPSTMQLPADGYHGGEIAKNNLKVTADAAMADAR